MHRQTKKRATISVALGAALLLSASTASAAVGAPFGGKPVSASALAQDPVIRQFVQQVGLREISNQDALEVFRGWIFTRSGFERSGWVGSIDNLKRKAMTIMWYGPQTAFLSEVIREGARRGIAVTVQHRAYSLAQIHAAIAEIWRQAAEGKWAGFKISAIEGVSLSSSAITVKGTYTSLPANRRAPQVRALATAVSGVAVQIAPGTSVTLTSGRDSDVSPFNSGGFMSADNGSGTYCTSGFAVGLNGVTHTMTARHCLANDEGNDWVDANDSYLPYSSVPSSQRYGTHVEYSQAYGAADILSGAGYPLTFTGNFSSANTDSVIGFGDVGVGDLICTEGGNSGSHCNIKVTVETVSICDALGCFDTIEATQQSSNNIAVESGDSGGPVITLANTSSGQVRASGMIQAGSGTPSNCASYAAYIPTTCYDTVYFTSARTIVKFTSGLTLDTVDGLISG